MRSRSRRWLEVPVVVLLALAGCATEVRNDTDPRVASYFGIESSPKLTPERYNKALSDCMRKKGFRLVELPKIERTVERKRPLDWITVPRQDSEAPVGYGIVDEIVFYQLAESRSNQTMRELYSSDSELAAYSSALKSPTDGCGVSVAERFPGSVVDGQTAEYIETLFDEYFKASAKSSLVLSANKSWSACMRQLGQSVRSSSPAEYRLELQNSMHTELAEAFSRLEEGAKTSQVHAAASKAKSREVAVAQADARCQVETYAEALKVFEDLEKKVFDLP